MSPGRRTRVKDHLELIPVAMRLIRDVDGVVVISRVSQAPGPQHATAAGDRGGSR
jgi:hypothetical protein